MKSHAATVLLLLWLSLDSEGKFQCAEGDEDNCRSQIRGQDFFASEPLGLKMEACWPF